MSMNDKQLQNVTINGKNYTILGKLGAGGSCEVVKVMDNKSSIYALKCVDLGKDRQSAQCFVKEIKLLHKLQGSNRVIKMYDYEEFVNLEMVYIVLELGDVDFSSFLRSYKINNQSISYPALVGYWTEMLAAVKHIHDNNIIHSDLKPANFLLVRGHLKLIDFGMASLVSVDASGVLKDSTMGTFDYISPEAITNKNGMNTVVKITYKSDVWSLGCILYEMLYGEPPFREIIGTHAKLVALQNKQNIDYPTLENMPPILMKALQWSLTYNVKRRPSVQDLIDLEYINCNAVTSSTSKRNKKNPLAHTSLEEIYTPDQQTPVQPTHTSEKQTPGKSKHTSGQRTPIRSLRTLFTNYKKIVYNFFGKLSK